MRPAFGRPVVPSCGPITSQGWETTGEVRSGGRELGSCCCCCGVGRLGGIYSWKHREELRGGWRVGKPPACRKERGHSDRDRGRECREKQGGQAQSPSVLQQPRKPFSMPGLGQCHALEPIRIFPGTAPPQGCSHPSLLPPLFLQTCLGGPFEGLVEGVVVKSLPSLSEHA